MYNGKPTQSFVKFWLTTISILIRQYYKCIHYNTPLFIINGVVKDRFFVCCLTGKNESHCTKGDKWVDEIILRNTYNLNWHSLIVQVTSRTTSFRLRYQVESKFHKYRYTGSIWASEDTWLGPSSPAVKQMSPDIFDLG